MRYVFKKGEKYVKWVGWTAGVIPVIRLTDFDHALIVNEEYLDFKVEKTGKTRRQLIADYNPDIDFIQVNVTIA